MRMWSFLEHCLNFTMIVHDLPTITSYTTTTTCQLSWNILTKTNEKTRPYTNQINCSNFIVKFSIPIFHRNFLSAPSGYVCDLPSVKENLLKPSRYIFSHGVNPLMAKCFFSQNQHNVHVSIMQAIKCLGQKKNL